jgi:hypothetical protein
MSLEYYTGFFVIATVLAQGCVEKYEPPVTIANKNFLVVDGYIKSGTDTTIITLSRTSKLGTSIPFIPELNRHIFIEKDGAVQ